MRFFNRSGLGWILVVACASSAWSAQPQSSVGRRVESFSLKDYRGKDHSLADLLRGRKALAVVFLGTECPLAKLYSPRMTELAKDFDAKGVGFVGIDSNRQDAITELDGFARQQGLTFPILKDVGNKVADQFGATRTPEAFVLDAEGTIRYQGRIDDQYTFGAGVGYAKPQLKRRDMAEAVAELLAGKTVSVPVTEARGCIIGRVKQAQKQADVTYSNQVVRILNQRCVTCHRPGAIGPFAMTNYDEVAGWGEMIAEVIREQRMPPWHANPAYGHFANAAVLSDKEKSDIYAWVEAGCPEGNPAELPPAPKFPEGWLLERTPEKIVYMSDAPVDVKAEGVEPYRYYVADPGFKEDKWIKSAECMPGNPSVVHHIIVFVAPPEAVDKLVEMQKRQAEELAKAGNDPETIRKQRLERRLARRGRARRPAQQPSEGRNAVNLGGRGDADISGMDLLCGFAPGTRPFQAPAGMAKKVPAGWKFIFQLHYTPNGAPQKDRSAIGLLFEDPQKITHRLATSNTANFEFVIPPNTDDYKVEADKAFVRDTLLLSMYPHMHIRGKSFRYELTWPDGRKEILLDVPRYDFNWQNWFMLTQPLLIPAGSKLHCTAYFDNSENNLFNPDPSKPVYWGDQTWEEMMIGWYDVAFPKDEAEQLLAEQRDADRKEFEEAAQRIQKRIQEQREKAAAAKDGAAKNGAANSDQPEASKAGPAPGRAGRKTSKDKS
jgi:peroxiredoxin